MVAVNGPSSEAFASVVLQAFDPLLNNRPWAPLQAYHSEDLQGIPWLRPLGPDLAGSKYDFEFLRAHCAVLDADGKIDSLYIAIQNPIPSWDYLRTSRVFLPDFQISSEGDPMLDPDETTKLDQKNRETSNLSAEDLDFIGRDDWNATTNDSRRTSALSMTNAFTGRLNARDPTGALKPFIDPPTDHRGALSGDVKEGLPENHMSPRRRDDLNEIKITNTDDSGSFAESPASLVSTIHAEAVEAEPTESDFSVQEYVVEAYQRDGRPVIRTVQPPPTYFESRRFTRLAPDTEGHEIGADAVWTRIERNLVSTQVLIESGLRYEARPDYVAVLGVLSREEMAELARKSAEVWTSREGEPLGMVDQQGGRAALSTSSDSAPLAEPTTMSPMSSFVGSVTIRIRATYTEQATLDAFFGQLFGYGKATVLVRRCFNKPILLGVISDL